MEEGGKLFRFEGMSNNKLQKVVVKVHSPQFYWKVFNVTLMLSLIMYIILELIKLINGKKKAYYY